MLIDILFVQGQYKSTLVCPVCRKVSVTFDPFMYLSLPLPSAITRKMSVTVFSGDGIALPMPYTVTVSRNGCFRDLIQALSIACCLKSYEALLVVEVKFVFHVILFLKSFTALNSTYIHIYLFFCVAGA